MRLMKRKTHVAFLVRKMFLSDIVHGQLFKGDAFKTLFKAISGNMKIIAPFGLGSIEFTEQWSNNTLP